MLLSYSKWFAQNLACIPLNLKKRTFLRKKNLGKIDCEMSLEVSSRHVRILRTGERGGPRLSFMASELLRWLSALP